MGAGEGVGGGGDGAAGSVRGACVVGEGGGSLGCFTMTNYILGVLFILIGIVGVGGGIGYSIYSNENKAPFVGVIGISLAVAALWNGLSIIDLRP
jgi:hypothetical protein